MKTSVAVAGKLFVAGEYAVTQTGGKAILLAVDRFLTVSLRQKSADKAKIVSKHFDNPVTWSFNDSGEIQADTTAVGFKYLAKILAFAAVSSKELGLDFQALDIEIVSELESSEGVKYGLGSSGALLSALYIAFNKHFNWGLTKLAILKLSLLANWVINPQTSGGDLVASQLGSWVYYQKPNSAKLIEQMTLNGIGPVLASSWEHFEAFEIAPPSNIACDAVWLGEPSDTNIALEEVQQPKVDEELSFQDFVATSNEIVEELLQTIENMGPASDFLRVIKMAKENLRIFLKHKKSNYEPDLLSVLESDLSNRNQVIKISGSGGGDCALVFSDAVSDTSRMFLGWQNKGIKILYSQIPG